MYKAEENRYTSFKYRKVGHSGLVLPPLSLGCWHNFGDNTAIEQQKQILYTAFDHGINHFDLANNYGTPFGSAEKNIGYFLKNDFKRYRDELIISTKAGWDMWAGPYGQGGSGRKYLTASLDQSLNRLGLDYVDIFYSHRYDADTPLEETAQTLADFVRQGKALYIGISSGYTPELTSKLTQLLAQYNVPMTIHQPVYNLLNRDLEKDILPAAESENFGLITFSPLAQGLLGGRYLNGIPNDSRVARGSQYLTQEHIQPQILDQINQLNEIAKRRGQTLAQLAISWVLRHKSVTSTIIGASQSQQILENLKSLDHLDFSADELRMIDQITKQ
ncbi:aldo/keto reductase [Acinetobacter sp. B5B]|uniref:aldo/keto reductase n=1 Tax=Acinetobacter baretiae TaxID=2605383 RepID=UPI0018C2DD73|nr:aldo/keto reductase [Acinetobacter baretiae]MBF7681803.1 aldo/keto reductase [Acinetobacter baretiae]